MRNFPGSRRSLIVRCVHRGSHGLGADRARVGEAEVRRWRAEGTRPMPEFPPERVERLGGTLDYPPNGSSERRRTAPMGRG
jgi:hypothetical protein